MIAPAHARVRACLCGSSSLSPTQVNIARPEMVNSDVRNKAIWDQKESS